MAKAIKIEGMFLAKPVAASITALPDFSAKLLSTETASEEISSMVVLKSGGILSKRFKKKSFIFKKPTVTVG